MDYNGRHDPIPAESTHGRPYLHSVNSCWTKLLVTKGAAKRVFVTRYRSLAALYGIEVTLLNPTGGD
jgi:hypothetical protein